MRKNSELKNIKCLRTFIKKDKIQLKHLHFAFFAAFIFAKKCEISRKSLRNKIENVRIFSLNVSVAGNPAL